MSNRKNDLSKRYLFVQSSLTSRPEIENPAIPRATTNLSISQRGLLSVLTVVLSLGALTAALVGGARMILDILNDGLMNNLHLVWAKTLVLALAYLCGWISAAASIRAYGNLVLPILIRMYAWTTLAGTSVLYILVLERLFKQVYDLPHYWAYLLMVAAGLAALVGLHLVLDEHDLRPYAIPLLLINLIQLSLIVIRYVFTSNPNPWYLWGDLLFFSLMISFSGLMLAHLGLLTPYRRRIYAFFEMHSPLIRPP